MYSKFKWTAYLLPFVFMMIFSAFAGSIILCFYPDMGSAIEILIPGMICAILALGWLVFGEFRMKMIRLELEYDHLTIRRYMGLSAPQIYYYADLSGFTVCFLPGTTTVYEYLYIKQGDKNIGKLSEFYHKNYTELKKELEKHIKYLDVVDFSYWTEVKDIFK